MKQSILDDYLCFCPNTNPGQYRYMYEALPTSLESLCNLIQSQLVHPWDGSEQPQGRRYDPRANYKIETILAKLHQFNEAGLVQERTVNERVIAGCRESALLLTSILRHQGVPARARAGWCKYVSRDGRKYVDHWITEVWNQEEGRWMLVDAKPKKIDFSPEEFQFGGEAWLVFRRGEAAPEIYRQQEDWFYLKLNFGHDFNTVLGSGPHYWEAPPLFHQELEEMDPEQLMILDDIAEMLREPDVHLEQLRYLQKAHPELQGLKSAWPIFEKTVYR